MIAQVAGEIVHKGVDGVVVDVSGVGYHLHVSMTTLAALPPCGSKATVKVHTLMRDDAIALYGFVDDDERALFRLLLGVAGIGPRLALIILSGLSPIELGHAIRNGEVARLVKIPGVGKRTAERLVLELGDKLASAGLSLAGDGQPASVGADAAGSTGGGGAGGQVAPLGGARSPDLMRDLADALSSLGLKPAEVDRTCRALRSKAGKGGATLEGLLSEALRL